MNDFTGRTVLVTGHTGFKGSWLSIWLNHLGARVVGYALDPLTIPSNFVAAEVADLVAEHHVGDLRDRERLHAVIASARPDVVFHLAARTTVLEGYAEPVDVIDVNVRGTAILLDILRKLGRPVAAVLVSSDKCYENDGSGRRLVEGDPMGGADPYSASKGAMELIAAAYRRSFFDPAFLDRHGVAIATARAGNVIAGGDWTPDGLIADVNRALVAGRSVDLRSPGAIRPWQHVLEPLSGYLALADRLVGPNGASACGPWNFGPADDGDATVREVVNWYLDAWGSGTWKDVGQADQPHEAAVLRLAIERAGQGLGWRPRWDLATAIRRTADWFRAFGQDPATARASCLRDITAYEAAASREA